MATSHARELQIGSTHTGTINKNAIKIKNENLSETNLHVQRLKLKIKTKFSVTYRISGHEGITDASLIH